MFLHAAALAFYGLISVAPLVVVALWVTALVVGAGQVRHVADHLARLLHTRSASIGRCSASPI